MGLHTHKVNHSGHAEYISVAITEDKQDMDEKTILSDQKSLPLSRINDTDTGNS